MYIADKGAHQVFVQMGDELTRFAGTGVAGFGGDEGPADQAQLNQPRGVAVWPEENVVFIADTGNHRIRSVWYGNIRTYAGTGVPGFSGDGGPASQAQLNNPQGISVQNGILYIADTGNKRIRRVDLDGTISTVAGGGATDPYNGEYPPATHVILGGPTSVHFPFFDGRFYFVDGEVVFMVNQAGRLLQVAGFGSDEGDGGSAKTAKLYNPTGVFYRFQDGSLYIAETGKNRIRRVNAEGLIGTFAGNGLAGFSGDGGLSRHAELNAPTAITQHQSGTFFVADTGNARVRNLNLVTPNFSWFSGYEIPSEDRSEIYRFDNLGYHLATLDARTGAVKYGFQYVAWNTMGELILSKIVDRDCSVETCNEVLRIDRDENQLPTTIVAQFGQQTTLGLNSSNYVQQITNPAGEIYSLTWSNDRLVSWTDPRGGIHGYFYDSLGRLTGDQGPAGFGKSLTRIDYESGSYVVITSALGHKRAYTYQDTGGGEMRILSDYDNSSLMTNTETDGSKSTTFPDGSKLTSYTAKDPQYGPWGGYEALETLRLPSGLTQTVARHENVVRSANPFEGIAVNSRTSITTINGRSFTQHWDGVSRTSTTTSPIGRSQSASVNDRGLPTTTTIPGLIPVSYTYDNKERVTQVTQGDRTYSVSYNSAGQVGSVTDSLSRTLNFQYNSAGRMTQQTLPDGRQILFAYDASGNLTSLTPPGRPAHSFLYTAADQTQSYTPPALGGGNVATQYSYDVERKLTQVTRPDGAMITYDYDSKSRLSTRLVPGGYYSYVYYNTGQLSLQTTPDNNTLQYGWNGPLQTEVSYSGAITSGIMRTFDNNFRMTTEMVHGASINYVYDNDGLLTSAGALDLTYSTTNGLLSGTSLGTITDTMSYNGHGEVQSYQAEAAGSSKFSVNYTRDNGGRIAQKAETILGENHTYEYSYDNAGRLTQVKTDGSVTSTYTYDQNSNRLTHTTAAGTTNGTYDAQDRLTQYGNASYSYTANGELSSKSVGTDTTSYTYDVLGNLKSVTLPDSTNITYVTDARNRRIAKKVGGVFQQGFIYADQLRIVAEMSGPNTLSSRFVYANSPNVPEYMIKGGATYRIITDHLGSPRLVINTSTNIVVQRMDYDEFGNVTADTNPGFQPFGFAGGLYDHQTKLVRFGARDYAADIGRWTAKDPIGFAGGDANVYAYTLGDPIQGFDPSGLDVFLCRGSFLSPGMHGLLEALGYERPKIQHMWIMITGEYNGQYGITPTWYLGTRFEDEGARNKQLDSLNQTPSCTKIGNVNDKCLYDKMEDLVTSEGGLGIYIPFRNDCQSLAYSAIRGCSSYHYGQFSAQWR